MLFLKAEEQSSKGQGREKLYIAGKKMGSKQSTERWNKIRSAKKRKWKKVRKSNIKNEDAALEHACVSDTAVC